MAGEIHHPRILGGFIGLVLGGILGFLSFTVFLFAYRPLHLHVGMSHALFTYLWMAAWPAAGALIGWLFPKPTFSLVGSVKDRWLNAVLRRRGRLSR